MVNKLARLSAAERRQIIDDFTAEVFHGLDPSPARFARWAAAPDLPDDPSAEQVEAWVDLAELVADRGFREQVRQVAGIGVQIQSGRWLVDVERAQDEAEAACQRGVPPESAEAARIVAQILDGTPGAQRRTISAMASGCSRSSESRNSTMSPVQAAQPVLKAPLWPWFAWKMACSLSP